MVQKPKTEVKPAKTSEEKKEKREKADLVLKELERITPQHRAYEFLRGITFDRTALSQNDDLANVIIDILRINDPNLYHDPSWLKKTQERLLALEQSPQISVQLQQIVSIVTRRVEAMLQKADVHRRRIEIEKELQQKEWLSDEAIEAEKKRIEQFGGRKADEPIIPQEEDIKDWDKAVEELPEDILPQRAKEDVEAIRKGKLADKDRNYVGELYREFDNAHKAIIKKLNKTAGAASVDSVNGPMKEEFEAAQKDYEKLLHAWEKTAKHIVEITGSEGGRLYEAMRSPQGEFVEKNILADANYRDYWFYHILEPILYNRRGDGHRELYNLYVAGDMDSFLEIVRRIKDPTTGERIGLKLALRYDILKNTLFQSHDMDYYAAHPTQDMKEFIGSTGLFVNTYIDAAHQDPLVSMAKRAYETALLQIRDTNNRYIPREWLTWEEGKLRASKWDELADNLLRQWIEAGQLYHIKTDDVTGTGLPAPSIWNRKQIDPNLPFTMDELNGYESQLSDEWRANLGDLKIAAALKQAKGLALVDQRLLEIISQSRGTGTEYEQSGDPDESFSLAAKQFNSIPYEGIVRHINPIVHYYTRFRMGGEYYDAFFNMLILDKWEKWDPEIIKKVVEYHVKGDHDGALEYLESQGLKDAAAALKTRLIEKENPFEYSGIWGPWTGWRISDTVISFDDWEREQAYGTNIKLITAGKWAERQARRHFEAQSPEYKAYRTQFRSHLKDSNNIYWREAAIRDEAAQNSRPDDFDDEFEAIWRKTGKDLKDPGVGGKTYRQLLDDLWEKSMGSYEDMINQLRVAYITRTWVQASMRSPLLVARYIDVPWNKDGYTLQSPLRKKIIWEILGIDIDEIAAMRTPKSKEEAGFDRVTELEGAVAAVAQTAIRENRDLRIEDFDRIGNLTLRAYAKEYWRMVKDTMLGKFKTAEQFYKELGIGDPDKSRMQGARMHNIDWNKVGKIVSVSRDAHGKNPKYKLLLETDGIKANLLNRDYKTTLFSTEDMGWEYLNIGALGERNPVRRAGDLASHVQFAQLFEKYINDLLVARPKIEDFVEAQKEMWTALSGDFVDIAIRTCYRIAYTTAMMYRKADISWEIPFASPIIGVFKDSSIMQMIRGRDRADAWGPNELLHYTQAVGGKQILPKREYHGLAAYAKLHEKGYASKLGPQFKTFTSGALGRAIGGTKGKATWEIISMTLMIATLLTIWRAFTAKDEEED